MQSLLDGHSEVITFPSTLLIGGLTGTHFDDFFMSNSDKSSEQIAMNFTEIYETAFDSTLDSTASRLNQLGDQQNQTINVNKDRFIDFFVNYFEDGSEKSYVNIFNGAHLAWAQAQGKKLGKKIIILHALHTPEDKMKMYCENFPESKHLVCVRNPVVSHNSRFIHHIKRYKINNKYSAYFQNVEHLIYPYNMTKDVLFALKTIGQYTNFEKVRCVRNEDLHQISKNIISKICKFLEIDFEPQLMESTFFGLKHWGDDTIEPRNGFSRKSTDNFSITESSFSTRDVALIEDLIDNRIQHFGYTRLTSKSKITVRRINRITKWEVISLFSILEQKTNIANLVVKSRLFGPKLHRFFLKILSKFLDESVSEILQRWVSAVELRVELMQSYIDEEKHDPEPKFKLI